jgi:MFS family permease
MGGNKQGLGVIFSMGFFSMFGISIGVVLQPLYTNDLGILPTKIGLLFFLSNLASGILRIPVGIASDSYGRKWFMLVGAALWSLSGSLFTIFESFQTLVIPFILWGIGSAFYFTVIGALIAQLTSPEVMPMVYGTFWVFQTIGRILGPLLGGFIADKYGFKPSFAIAAFSFLIAAVLAIKLPHLRSKKQVRLRSKLKESLRLIAWTKNGDPVKTFALLYIVHGVFAGMFWTILPLFFKEVYHLSYSDIGLINTASMIGIAAGSYLVTRFPQRFNLKKLMMYATLLAGVSVLGYVAIGIKLTLPIISFFTGFFLSFGTFGAVGSTVFMRSLSESIRGLGSGITGTSWRAGLAGGSILLGTLWTFFGMRPVFYLSTVMLFVESAIIWIGMKVKTIKK